MSIKKNSVIWLKDWDVLVSSLDANDQLYFWSELFSKYDFENVPICERNTVKPTWSFISSQLSNFTENYNKKVVVRNKENGLKGGRPRKEETQKNPMGYLKTQKTPKENVNVNVNDNVKNNIEERKVNFAHSLTPFLELYGKEIVRSFFNYWTEPNKSNTKFKMELEKTWDTKRRLETWVNNENRFNGKTAPKIETPEEALARKQKEAARF
jgi:hypothetical protein